MLLAICVAVAVLPPIVMLTYPLPQVRRGWCQPGGRPGHYTVETVATVALGCEILAVTAIVVLVTASRESWGSTARSGSRAWRRRGATRN